MKFERLQSTPQDHCGEKVRSAQRAWLSRSHTNLGETSPSPNPSIGLALLERTPESDALRDRSDATAHTPGKISPRDFFRHWSHLRRATPLQKSSSACHP